MKVRFHLPGIRYNFPLNMLLLRLMENSPHFFREGLEIASMFGEFPTSKWNGGRFAGGGDQCNAEFIRAVIQKINEEGIPIRYTYTNPLLTEADLQDPYCNFCMKEADNGMNEVIVVSPILEEYIRKNYPNFKITSSTCKEIRDMDALNEELEKDYKYVVLDYNLNNQFDLLEQIKQKEKCEFLVNACCIPNCPRRGEHYRFVANQEMIALKNRKLPAGMQIEVPRWYCEYGEKTSLYIYKDYVTHISPEAIWETYVPMGFNNFKLEGRTANIFLLIDTYAYYFAKPEYRDEMRLLLTANLEANKVITVNKPKKGVWP
ncbi:MAG: hypothetical protein J1E35_02500 [Lachnospiraceae bacterium]|nr:hypothetical protein [Lachnospiraceae bacterium]